jgi:hypothetical protein
MGPASSIPAKGTPIAALTLTLKIKPQRLDGTIQLIAGNSNSNYTTGESFFGVYINTSNQLVAQCGNNANRSVTTSALSVNTYYDVVVAITGLNTSTANTAQGNMNLTVNGSSVGDVTAQNHPFFSTFWDAFRYVGARGNTSEPFEGLIYEVGWTYDGNSHYWTAEASDRSNTGVAPVLTATTGAVDLNAISGNNFPTDGTAWVDSAGGADTTAPAWSSVPAVSASSDTGHTIAATLDEDCTLYGVRLASGAAQPTSAQIIAGTDSSDVAALETASGAATAATERTLVFSTGDVSTEYTYYFAAEDAAGNDSAVQTVTATTGAGSISVDGGTVTAGSAFTGTYSGIASLASPITFTDSQGNTLNVTINDAGGGVFNTATMPALPTSGSASSVLFGTLTVSGSP